MISHNMSICQDSLSPNNKTYYIKNAKFKNKLCIRFFLKKKKLPYKGKGGENWTVNNKVEVHASKQLGALELQYQLRYAQRRI